MSHMHPQSESPQNQQELLDVDAVARMFGCSRNHVDTLSRRGQIPRPIRLGHLRRWSRAVILRWIDAGGPQIDDCDFVRSEHPTPPAE